jgi:tellurite resistance protein
MYRNVVDEMSIASGTPAPALFVLDDPAINAFVAGYSPKDAALCVTTGSLDAFDRDELQGVVAHEFSHLLSGDMRLNMHMLGLLSGLSLVGDCGRALLRTPVRNNPSLLIKIMGGGLFCAGYVGLFMNGIIRAAISRQREYFADAAAAQFTRNPAGIARALLKTREGKRGSFLSAPRANELSHMYLAAGSSQLIGGVLASHPSIEDRVAAIVPSEFRKLSRAVVQEQMVKRAKGQKVVTSAGFSYGLDPRGIAAAARLSGALPGSVQTALGDPRGALALWCALLVTRVPQNRDVQLSEILRFQDLVDSEQVNRLWEDLKDADFDQRIAVAELATAAFARLEPQSMKQAARLVYSLINADQRISLFDVMLAAGISRGCRPSKTGSPGGKSIQSLAQQSALVVSAAAALGGSTLEAKSKAFLRAIQQFARHGIHAQLARTMDFSTGDLLQALVALEALKIEHKQALVAAVAAVGKEDGEISQREHELLRAVCWSLCCPLPPEYFTKVSNVKTAPSDCS